MLISLLLPTLLPSADAATHRVDIPVPTGPFEPHVTKRVSAHILRGAADGHPDVTATSTSPFVECAIEDGDVHVSVIERPHDTTPLPARAVCTWGPDRARIRLVHDTTSGAWDPSTTLLTADPPTIHVARAPEIVGFKAYALPPDLTFVRGSVAAVKADGEAWAGLACEASMGSDDRWVVWVKFLDPSTAWAEGTCELPTAAGGTYTVNLDVTRP